MHGKGPVELLDDGVALVRRDLAVVGGVAALAWLPIAIVLGSDSSGGSTSSPSVWLLVIGPLSLCFVAAAAAHADESRRAGVEPELLGATAAVARRAPVLVGAWIVVHVLELIGLVALGIVTLLVLVSSVPVTAIVMIERRGPIDAFRRSWQLTAGSRWALFWFVVVVAIVSSVISLVGSLVALVAFDVDIGPFGRVLATAAFLVSGTVNQAVVGAASVAVYRNQRVVREGADLAERIERMAA